MAVIRKDIALCTGCGNCVDTCPCDVFRMDEENGTSVIAYPEDCQVCNMCTIYCPTGSIAVTPEKCVKPITSWR
ncbi:MAG TPA: ferredoxin family protein [Dehalococcoidia bacterium]|nr:ferredoxin family protein [Dehalococcoidia bacterium]